MNMPCMLERSTVAIALLLLDQPGGMAGPLRVKSVQSEVFEVFAFAKL
jgi:hypothetical protein